MTENEAIRELAKIKNDLMSLEYLQTTDEEYEMLNTAISALEEIQQYREIGSLEEFREVVDRQKPKKILPLDRDGLLYEDGWRYKCPVCGCAVGENVYHPDVTKDFEYCSMCGQKITE